MLWDYVDCDSALWFVFQVLVYRELDHIRSKEIVVKGEYAREVFVLCSPPTGHVSVDLICQKAEVSSGISLKNINS